MGEKNLMVGSRKRKWRGVGDGMCGRHVRQAGRQGGDG